MTNHSQCKLCNMGVGIEPGMSQREIADKYGVHRRSVQRHMKHVQAGEQTPEPQVAATSTKSRTVLDVNGDKGTAEVGLNVNIDDFFMEHGIDPTTVNVTSRRIGQWEVNTAEGVKTLKSQKIAFTVNEPERNIDLPAMIAQVEKAYERQRTELPVNDLPYPKGTVVVWADPQTGKVDRLGGSQALTERILVKRDKLQDYIMRHPASSAVFLNLGDSVENIENTGAQLGTNDLSLINQLDLEATFEEMMIDTLAEFHPSVKVAVVPSNHCQLRRGKSLIGKPTDDYGIHIVRQLERAYKKNPQVFGHVEFEYPADDWTEHMTINIEGVNVGLVHGHQKNNPNQIGDWWAGQIHGGMLADAEILVTGHFHHFLARQTGVHLKTGRDKYHLQAPALDNGSSWFQNISGESSKPGLLVFQVDAEGGLDLGSLDIL